MPRYGVTVQHGYGGSLSPLLPERAVTHLVFCGEGEDPVLVAATLLMQQFPEARWADEPIELVERWNDLTPPCLRGTNLSSKHGIRQAESVIITNRDKEGRKV